MISRFQNHFRFVVTRPIDTVSGGSDDPTNPEPVTMMADRLPPPLPTERTSPPEQSAQSVPPVPAKPGKLELVQKTVADVATCVKGITQMVEFVEKHLGSGSSPKPPALPAAMPTGTPTGMPAMPSFPMNMPALPTESIGIPAADAGFGGFA